MLFVSQYSTRPAGKKKNMTAERPSGMIHIELGLRRVGGVGFSQAWKQRRGRHQQRRG
jgi:hypothetical protein